MTLAVIGYAAGTDDKGEPNAVPRQIMKKDFGTAEDALAYIRGLNRTVPEGKAFLFSITGTPDPVSDNGSAAEEVPTETMPDSNEDVGLAVSMACSGYALNIIGGMLTGLLTEESISSWLTDDAYDDLVKAQNTIVGVLKWMDGDESTDGDGEQEVAE